MLPNHPRHQIHCHKSASGSISRSLGLGLDMPVLQLLHHFDRHTASTLAFGTSLWRDTVLPLALHVRHLNPISFILLNANGS
jgi:hypothetical protein